MLRCVSKVQLHSSIAGSSILRVLVGLYHADEACIGKGKGNGREGETYVSQAAAQ